MSNNQVSFDLHPLFNLYHTSTLSIYTLLFEIETLHDN
jgi:hypothetical protein